MLRYPLLLVTILAGATLLLTGAGNSKPEPAAAPAPPDPSAPPAESAEAARLLDRAIEMYAPAKVAWLELTLWERIWENGVGREVQGRCLAAPGHRARLELKVQVGQTSGELKLIGDGKRLWQWQRLGDDPPVTSQGEMPGPSEVLKTPESVAWARGETLRQQGLLGPGPLLETLRQQTQGLRRQAVRWKGIEVVQVTGGWPGAAAKLARVPDYARPRETPRLWSVYLDAASLWPHRLEWWGSERPQDPCMLLLEMEFREPAVNRPLPLERCVREFTIPLAERPKP
jgi:hypothetical protein